MAAPPLRMSLVTLGTRDLACATAFYRALGAELSPVSQDGLSVFALGGVALALFDRAALAEDTGVADGTGFGGVTLAWNLPSEAAVDAAVAAAGAAGATVLKAPGRTSWGGYAGTFADPDGHPWEVAHNPLWPLGEDGRLLV